MEKSTDKNSETPGDPEDAGQKPPQIIPSEGGNDETGGISEQITPDQVDSARLTWSQDLAPGPETSPLISDEEQEQIPGSLSSKSAPVIPPDVCQSAGW